jgi:hypothetical protein
MWWEDNAVDLVKIRIFTSSFMSVEEGRMPHRAAKAASSAISHAVNAQFFELLEPFEWNSMQSVFGFKSTKPHWAISGHDAKIVPGEYVAIASPTLKVDEGRREVEADQAMDGMRGLLCALLGDSIAFDLAAEITVSKENPESIGQIGGGVRMPIPPESYVYTSSELPDHLQQYFLAEKDPLWRARVETAFMFVGRAQMNVDPRLRFFDLWTALEVYLGGPKSLAGHIDKGHHRPGWRTAMKALKDRRDGLVHRGELNTSSPTEERLILATIIDAVCKRARIVDAVLEEYLLTFVHK